MKCDQPLIVGYGDLGSELSRQLQQAGASVAALSRTVPGTGSIDRPGGTHIQLDLDIDPPPLWEYGQIFWFAPPPPRGETDPRLERALAALGQKKEAANTKLVYVSTSGVYGDCQGRWIDETEPCAPQSDRGKRRLHAESLLDDHARRHHENFRYCILRVPGIYGPSKLPMERLRKGLPVVRASESPYTNRIHVADLAGVAAAAMNRGRSGERYNVSDGNPTTMADYFTQCAEILGLPAPELISRQEASQKLSPAMQSFLSESKRLINRKMLDELGVTLSHPNLESGLPDCLLNG